jgi:site-specific recombinase XerD
VRWTRPQPKQRFFDYCLLVRPETRFLTEGEYQRLQLACSRDVRDGAIIELILQAGPRLSEVAAARLRDLELPARVSREGPPGAIHIHGKCRKERTVTLNYKACKALKSWLVIRPTIADDHVFVSKFKKPLGPRAIEDVVTKYLQEARSQNASTRSLRHTFATHSAKKGTKAGCCKRRLVMSRSIPRLRLPLRSYPTRPRLVLYGYRSLRVLLVR